MINGGKMLEQGVKAPDFSLPDQDGKVHSLKDFRGKNVVLYFYPKDNTPGCTKEACNFKNELPDFKSLNAEILGISADSVSSHKKFADKFGLPFKLLSDESREIINKYGVWILKTLYGKKSFGIERSTFVIDKNGIVRKIFRKVKVDNHNKELKEALKEL